MENNGDQLTSSPPDKYLGRAKRNPVVSREESGSPCVNSIFPELLTKATDNLFKTLQCTYQCSEGKHSLFITHAGISSQGIPKSSIFMSAAYSGYTPGFSSVLGMQLFG